MDMNFNRAMCMGIDLGMGIDMGMDMDTNMDNDMDLDRGHGHTNRHYNSPT
jgi:hypothetical protein